MTSIARVKSKIINKELVRDMQVRSVLFRLPDPNKDSEILRKLQEEFEQTGRLPEGYHTLYDAPRQQQLFEARGMGESLAIIPLMQEIIRGSCEYGNPKAAYMSNHQAVDRAIAHHVKNLNCGRNPDFPGIVEIYNGLPSLIETCYVISYGHSSTEPNAGWMNQVRTVKNSSDVRIGPVLDEIMAGISKDKLKARLVRAWHK